MFDLRRVVAVLVLALVGGASPALAQPAPSLSLEAAVGQVLSAHPQAEAARATVAEAEARFREVRANLLPRIDFEESFSRGNHPVFAFGTRLSQQRFRMTDFSVDALNDPDAITDHQSRLTAQVPLIHAPGWFGARAARLGARAAAAQERGAQAQLVFATLQGYFGVQLAEQALAVAEGAEASAQQDAAQVRALQEAGMATQVNALALEVAASAAEERRVDAAHNLAIARAGLNSLLGSALDAPLNLSTPLEQGAAPAVDVATALEEHPNLIAARRGADAARAAHQSAMLQWLPVVALFGEVQSHRQSLFGEGGENWMVGVAVRLNLFAGLGDLSRSQAQRAARERAEAMLAAAESQTRLEIEEARLSLESATARVELSARTAAMAAEAMRQEEHRLAQGMSDTAALMRSRSAHQGAELQRLGATYAQRMAAARLALALGQLDRNAGAPSEEVR